MVTISRYVGFGSFNHKGGDLRIAVTAAGYDCSGVLHEYS